MSADRFNEWVLRVFGSVEAHRASLPKREWVRRNGMWFSRERA